VPAEGREKQGRLEYFLFSEPSDYAAAVGAGFLLLIYGAYYLVRKKEGLGLGDVTMLPYGSFLAPAAFVALVWGEAMVSAYLRLFQ
jgi:leader peptidase (prepilin peptidase) / N-methyltransferase